MCWYIIRDNGEFLARSSVIAVDEFSKGTSEVRDQMDKFTKNLESRIGNNTIPKIDTINAKNIYYTPFGATTGEDVEDLPYGDDFTALKMRNIDDRYLEELEDLIGT